MWTPPRGNLGGWAAWSIMPEPVRVAVVRGGLWALAARIASATLGLLGAALTTRVLVPDQVGIYYIVLSIVGIMVTAGSLGLHRSVASLIPQASVSDPRAVGAIQRRAYLLTLSAGLAAGTILALSGTWSGDLVLDTKRPSETLWLLSGSMVLVGALRVVAIEGVRALGNIRAAAVLGDIVPNALFTGTLALLLLSGRTYQAVALLIATLIAWTVTLALGILTFHSGTASRRGFEAPSVLAYLRIGLPWVGISVLASLVNQAGTVVLGISGSESDAALYASVWRVAVWVALPLTVVASVLPPFVVRLWAANDETRVNSLMAASATLITIASVALCAIVVLFGESILSLLYGPFYAGAATILTLLAIGQVGAAAAGLSIQTLVLMGQQSTVLVVAAIVAPLTLILMVLLASLLGGSGVAIATSLGVASQAWLAAFLTRRRTGIRSTPPLSWRSVHTSVRDLLGVLRGV